MYSIQEAFNNNSIEKIGKIPKNIAEIFLVDIKKYKSYVGSKNEDDIKEKGIIDSLLNKLRIDPYSIGHIDKENIRIYIKRVNWERKVTERKIIEFLKGE